MRQKPIIGAAERFYLNASLGRNGWWRWGFGFVGIILIWQGIGAIPWLVACQYLRGAQTLNFSCDGVTISGDSLVPHFVLSFYPFIIGIIGVWLAVKLLHRKDLTHVVTGRASFDYNRTVYAILIGLILYSGWFLVGVAVFQDEIRFQAPNFWEYLTFFLFAIVLVPYQAGFEEVFFRGYILQRFILLGRSKWFLVSASAVVFVLPHLLNPEPWAYGPVPYILSLLLFGAFVTVITLLDGGIELAVGYHALNNLFITLVSNTEVSAVQTPSLFVVPIGKYELVPGLLMEVAIYALAVLIFNLKYGWFRWRN